METLEKLVGGNDLDRTEAARVMGILMDGGASDTQIGALLAALRLKGEKPVELLGFLDAMRDRVISVKLDDPDAIDLCGTGGDGLCTINVSTVASFIVAGAGVTVAKHGNRSVSSKSGSADVLRELGVNVDMSVVQTQRCINDIGIGFLFAPIYHPAMKYAAKPRSELGFKTCFNLLGPLSNPAGVRRQVIGTWDGPTAQMVSDMLLELKSITAFVINSNDGMDEVSPCCETTIHEIREHRPSRKYEISPETFGVQIRHPSAFILGGTPRENAEFALAILSGQRGPLRDFVLINSALGLQVASDGLGGREAFAICSESIDSGSALGKLRSLVEYSGS